MSHASLRLSSTKTGRPAPIIVPSQGRLAPRPPDFRSRTPTRTQTTDQAVELDVYVGPERATGTPPIIPPSPGPSEPRFRCDKPSPRRQESLFLSASEWRTDIITFCSHARLDSVLGQARVTHVQARKSRRPPFLHEYILVFFVTSDRKRFVLRIDRLGKIGWMPGGGILGWFGGLHGRASNTAVQQVGVYHIQDEQAGIDSPGGAWYAYDGKWGSQPLATLANWSDVGDTLGHVSHHLRDTSGREGPAPRLCDVSRLLEAILLEMPTYHLTTTNCYFMTRASLLLLQRCFAQSFACFVGSASGELVPATNLAEPVWAGLLRWYLPFVVFSFSLYIPLIFLIHHVFTQWAYCRRFWSCPEANNSSSLGFSPISRGLYHAAHGLFDVPLPLGLLHAWMTALEIRTNELVTKLSTEFHRLQPRTAGSTLLVEPQPFGVASERAWVTFGAWCMAGFALATTIFITTVVNPLVLFGLFAAGTLIAVVFNLISSSGNILLDAEHMATVAEPEPMGEAEEYSQQSVSDLSHHRQT